MRIGWTVFLKGEKKNVYIRMQILLLITMQNISFTSAINRVNTRISLISFTATPKIQAHKYWADIAW